MASDVMRYKKLIYKFYFRNLLWYL